ncbi:phosphate ABC transporter substrate-binding/OmpA family protein [Halovulum sp. GXIMD14793]
MSASRVSCEGAACPEIAVDDADFIIAGSDTIGDELMPLLLEGFGNSMGAETDLTTTADASVKTAAMIGDDGYGDEIASVLIESRGSSTAFREMLAGRAEIGMASRRIHREEARELRAKGAGNMVDIQQERAIAVDSLLILVSPQNPVDALTIDQIARIYSGDITNWADLGGPDLPITVYSRSEESGTRGVFDGRTLEPRGLSVRADAVIVGDNIEMSRDVSQDPSAIGYAGFAFQRGAKSIDVITECGLRTRANPFEAKTEEYPYQRRLYLYSKSEVENDQARQFLDFVTTSAADSLVTKGGFIDLGVTRRSQDVLVERLRQAMSSLTDDYEMGLYREIINAAEDWDRLSTTFRLPTGATHLSAKGQRDLERLMQYLEAQPEGTEVALVAFTDDQGPEESNHQLALKRGAEVMQDVVAAAGNRTPHVTYSSMGFGELAPAACNETEAGRAVNRRVEVWIR